MIERLNFYDIYGYLIPGILLLTILLFPYELSREALQLDWKSAALGLVIAYIFGHVIQGMARVAFPSTRSPARSRLRRNPSEILLDANDQTFSSELKRLLIERIRAEFKIELEHSEGNQDVIRKRRDDAFMLCRMRLIHIGTARYAEQFEGLYALMRGVTASCSLGTAYYIGFLIQFAVLSFPGVLTTPYARLTLAMVSVLLLLLAGILQNHRIGFWLMALLLLLFPTVFLAQIPERFASPTMPATVAFLLVFFALRCCSAYRFFAKHFAMTVYRDFCALPLPVPPPPPATSKISRIFGILADKK